MALPPLRVRIVSMILVSLAFTLGATALEPPVLAATIAQAESTAPHANDADGHDHSGHAHDSAEATSSTTETEQHSESDQTGHADGHDAHDHAESVASAETASAEAADEATDAHDHSAHDHGGDATGFGKLIAWLGKFHPPMINFPIALLIAGAIAELLAMGGGQAWFKHAARFCVWGGALGALAAGVLGWFFAGFDVAGDDWMLATHRWLGTTTALWAVLVLILSERYHRNGQTAGATAYRTALFIGVGLVAVTGFFGGAMLYGLDHYAW